jgi:hypothetical protein
MSKLTRRASYVFTGDQPDLPSIERRTIPSKEDVITFYRTHERVSWSLTEVLDIPWSDIRVDALAPADAYTVESAMLVESNNPDYVANLLEYFKDDQDVCDFIMMWGIEEWKHYYALRDYIVKVRIALTAHEEGRGVAPEDTARVNEIRDSIDRAIAGDIAGVREASTTQWGIPPHYTPPQVVANTTVQEFVTAEFYRYHAAHTKEPVLARIETLLGKDETRHEMFYEQKLKDCLADDPSVMPSVLAALKEFGMPGAYLLDDYEPRRAAMEAAAFPTLAERKEAFVRLFAKMERIVGHDNAMEVFTEGNYLTDGQPSTTRKKMRPEMITRLLTRKLVGSA